MGLKCSFSPQTEILFKAKRALNGKSCLQRGIYYRVVSAVGPSPSPERPARSHAPSLPKGSFGSVMITARWDPFFRDYFVTHEPRQVSLLKKKSENQKTLDDALAQ